MAFLQQVVRRLRNPNAEGQVRDGRDSQQWDQGWPQLQASKDLHSIAVEVKGEHSRERRK